MSDQGATSSVGGTGGTAPDPGPSPPAPARHRLTTEHLVDLARGGGRDTVAVLRSGQRSRRLVLLRALVETLDGHPPPDASLPAAQHAWDLLAAAETANRPAVEAVLLHPSVGSWLARTLRALRPGAGSPAPHDALADARQVHALAAAAALSARLRFTARVPVLEAGVLLPSLGGAPLPRPTSAPAVEVYRDARGAGVRWPSGTVPLPDDLTEDAPGWWALRRLRSTGERPPGSLVLDDLDPWRHYLRRLPVERLDDTEAATWQRLYRAAWRLVAGQRRIDPAGVADCLLALTPLPDRSPAELFSGSAPEAYGGVLMTRPAEPAELAAALVHEAQHIKLSALMDMVTLLSGGLEEVHYAPWRADPRPLRGMLHGVHAFLGVASFWQARREQGGLGDAELARADFEFALSRGQVEEALGTLWAEGTLTGMGELYLREVGDTLAALLEQPVPREPARAAQEARDDHRTVFRLSHSRCDSARVSAWADALVRGEPAPRRFPEVRRRTGPVVPDVRTRLVRVRLGDPERFARLRADPVAGAGASATDYAWAAGDRAAALAGYRHLVAEDPDAPAAWAGLGLSLPEGQAREALLHHPELVASVHRELLRRGSGRTPEAVAAWIGEAGARARSGPGGG